MFGSLLKSTKNLVMRNKGIIFSFVLIIVVTLSGFYYFFLKANLKIFNTCDSELYELNGSYACIVTNFGVIIMELYPDAAPVAVSKFKELIDSGFYDGLEFYRVVPGFVIQGGIQDFYTRRAGMQILDKTNQSKIDRFLNDKFNVEVNLNNLDISESEKVSLSNLGIRTNPSLNTRIFEYGSVGFANKGDTDPNTNSTEFFIVIGDKDSDKIRFLNGRFTNFAKVVKGLDVLKMIESVEIDQKYKYSTEKSKPLKPVKIIEVKYK